jgi:hypothetical protein
LIRPKGWIAIMAFGRLPVMRAARVAYGDLARVLTAMPALVLIALAIDLAADLALYFRPAHGMAALALASVTGLGKNWFLTPFFIAVHRFILVGEVADRYRLDPQDRRFARFFTWSLVLWLMLAFVPALAIGMVSLPLALISPTMAMSVLALVVIIAAVVSVRLIVLFPAIAVDAPGATPANAFADMQGFAFDVFLICALAILPVVAIEQVMVGMRAQTFAAMIFDTLVNLVIRVLLIVVASRAFQALGDRVLRAAVT